MRDLGDSSGHRGDVRFALYDTRSSNQHEWSAIAERYIADVHDIHHYIIDTKAGRNAEGGSTRGRCRFRSGRNFVLVAGADEVGEQGMWVQWFRPKLWMELNSNEPRVVDKFERFDEFSVR